MTHSSAPTEVTGHDLQDLSLSCDPGCEHLFKRLVDETDRPVTSLEAGSIASGFTLRLDTLQNAFFERYWRELAGLTTLELAVVTSGPCSIRAIRRARSGAQTLLADIRTQGERVASVIAIDLATMPIDDTVIYAEVQALGEAAALLEGGWRTRDQARNDVRLVIATCSFGREHMLVANLDRLAAIVARSAEISELIVVHQGKQALTELQSYRELLSSGSYGSKLRAIHQDNFGGTGGFTRGMIEAIDCNASHVLLLDDDIKIEPTTVERLIALLRFLKTPTTIGGQMLYIDRPTMMHASHESVHLEALVLCNPCEKLDMAAPDAINLFAARHHCNYNAWWFCCIPISTIRRIGLPVPMFVRYDDIEFGVRTIAEKSDIVAFPGIFVWHEGYTKKQTCSFIYYDRRNAMISAAFHGQLSPWRAAARHWRHAWIALRNFRFEGCWALCRAAEDFLSGPDLVFSDLPGRHRKLLTEQARFTLLTMAIAQHHLRSASGQGRRRLPSLMSVLLTGRLYPGFIEAKTSGSAARFASTTRTLAYAVVRTSLALLFRGRRAGAAYRAASCSFTGQAFWRRLLALPPDPTRLPRI